MLIPPRFRTITSAFVILGYLATATVAAPPTTKDDLRELYQRSSTRAIQFLRSTQAEDGSFSAEVSPAVTALVATSLMRIGVPARDPVVAKAVDYVEQFVQADGGIYQPGSLYRNYETCLAILCLTETKDPRFRDALARAEAFVREIQWDEGEDHDPSSPAYGGAGYGNHKRPDLSNTSFLVEALHAAGAEEDDEALQRALIFVSRCQNLESQYNTLPFSTKNPDGGFYYTPAAGGTSQAGVTEEGGLRSYGSMTYAGLKSMIYAGLGPDDPRVQAAVDWIQRHYDLSENPGMPPQMRQAGLYYYYHTFAKALDALGQATVEDARGATHDSRVELIRELASKQTPTGAWVNENPRWLEGDANLVTGYALLSLSYCQQF